MSSFSFPVFHKYPPYFTLQPITETREKQLELWRNLITQYCKHQKVFVLLSDATDECPLFVNKEIDRRLNAEARLAILESLIANGNGLWLDKEKQRCLVLWKKLGEWADTIYSWVRSQGLESSVMTVEELHSGDEVEGSELKGLHPELLIRALQVLEDQGKAKLFRGATTSDQSVKFFPPP
eukprot:jgi/Botrbrau1/6483/Bobra.0034s0056.1